MFKIEEISLVQFRNYAQAGFTFSNSVTGICGKNGSGQTNLLDAVYYLCFTKSYFGKTDLQNTQLEKSGFRLEGKMVLLNQQYQITCVLRENGKKEFGVNHENYSRFATHIGKFPCVMIAPDDVAIITQGSEERRKFMDYTISQMDADYLQNLIDYNKILQQRNSLLKQLADTGSIDKQLMDIISDQLVGVGQLLFSRRSKFLDDFIPVVSRLYHSIAQNDENLTITYQSHLKSIHFKELLLKNKAKDIALQRTTQGIHRDDLEFGLDGFPFKNIASQGQRKCLLFALKLAEFEVLSTHKGFPPILLLDDIFEKLDESRMKNLLAKVCVENQGQVLISDTHYHRLKEALDELGVSHDIIVL